MPTIKIKIAAFANVVIITLLAALTVNKFSPEFLNADVIINSVISLQNVTLFYWGQNRLINLLPFLASLFRDPVLNLYFILFTVAFAHYVLLFFFAKIAIAFSRTDNQDYLDTKVFLVISLIFITITKNSDIFSIAVWHVEYPLALLIILLVFWGGVTERLSFNWWLILSMPLIFVATGLNYSIIILSCALVCAYPLYTKKTTKYVVAFGIISVFSFIVFKLVADQYGDMPYSNIHLEQLPLGITSVAINLINAFNVWIVTYLVLCIIIIRVIYTLIGRESVFNHSRIEIFVLSSIAVFCFGWLILFSSNKWVEMNQFHYRYFTFIIYGFFMFVALQTSKVLKLVGYRTSWVIAGGSFMLMIMMLWGSFIHLPNYAIFKKVESVTPESHSLYAGDYWLVWPSVFRDMMAGKHSFGLTFRGEDNRENVKAFVGRQLSKEGYFSVICLNDKLDNCKKQISSLIGPGFANRVVFRDSNVSEIILKQMIPMSAPLGDADFALQLLAEEVPVQWQKDQLKQCTLRVKNNGKVILSGIGNDFNDPGKYAVRLSYRWVDDGSSAPPLSGFDNRTALPEVVKPNEEITMNMIIKAPSIPGKYWLEIEAVQELVAWFKDKGSPGIRIVVDVR